MPDRFNDLIPQPIPVQKITFDGLQRLVLGLVVLLIGVVAALLLAVGSLMSDLSEVQANQRAGQERGNKIRAVSCQALAYLVVTDDLPDVCLEPAVLEFYDPERVLTVPDEGA